MPESSSGATIHTPERWYAEITRYQWIVLLIASLGWVFDVFEGQIFVASMQEAMPSLAPGASEGRIALYNNVALGAFLIGGALGGIVFGMLSDRVGRKRVLSWTILFYSVFTCLSAFSQQWWHLAGLRFLVALGVGGEWAVASSLIAEVFPNRARAHVGGIFHATSVLGVYLAVAAGVFLIGNASLAAWSQSEQAAWLESLFNPSSLPWRLGFAIGVFPALLIVWIRRSLKEPESWQAARNLAAVNPQERMGTISELFSGALLRRTAVGVTLATVGMATFWGAHIYGKDMLRSAVENRILAQETAPGQTLGDEVREGVILQDAISLKHWEMLGMFLTTTGAGIGLLAFGPLCERIGRRGAFLAYQVGGIVSAFLVFQVIRDVNALLTALPIFGFLTGGMHAGFAIYFPELYPTRLRGTGSGFCFNAGRVLAAPALVGVGWVRNEWGYSLPDLATALSLLFLVGIAALVFAPETRGRELPT
jgi:MFS family permease